MFKFLRTSGRGFLTTHPCFSQIGIITIPLLFQQSGWLVPILCFFAISFLAALGCLFLIESMTYFPGNEKFQRNVELTVLVHQFYGRKWYYMMHIVLYGSLQSFNIASIISAAQTFDSFLITLTGQTCGYGISPLTGFICVSEQTNSNSPFGDNYMLATAGFILLLVMVIPLISLNLNDNLIVQLFSVVYLGFIIFVWVLIALAAGVNRAGMTAIGTDLTPVLGTVMFNYTLANTVPSWVNTKHKSVPIAKTIWYSVGIATTMYVTIGIFGGAAFPMPADSNLIQAVAASSYVSGAGKAVNSVINVTYPMLVLLTSIPVSIIIVKLNLVSSRLCTGAWAQFWAAAVPFLAALPFQTGAWITQFSNWTSLIFQSTCNFAAPFLVYLFLPRRNLVMQQSVLDELEFLDLDAGIKKWRDDDDDFDYVYHLPHADLTRLGMRRYNPFAEPAQQSQGSLANMPGGGVGGPGGRGGGGGGAPSIGGASNYHLHGPKYGNSVSQLSTASGQSARALMRQMLGPGGGGPQRRAGRSPSLAVPGGDMSSRRTSMTGASSVNLAARGAGSRRLSSMLMGGGGNKIHPMGPEDDMEAGADGAAKPGAGDPNKRGPMEAVWIEDVTGEMGQFRAMPYWLRKRVPPNLIAFLSLVIMMIASLVVFVLDVKNPT
ncbi:hypothetical protein HDU87_001881 [Geranomyces variabilis]|uniref:Amino acid transporter transmembrane domain-containing protein n=1 Tax=Geranomyces variabilis TaxID=109894 RepID=A0AAD5XRT8_9FUNG|nr:hypothetical protein HDU87_001881 [Geranomyces variabilis]